MGHTETLQDIVSQNLLKTKWLVAPSLRVAHGWIESHVRSGQPAVNLRPTTIDRLAQGIIGNQLTCQSIGVADPSLAMLALEAVWSELPVGGYFGHLPGDGSLPRLVGNAILRLRLADVDLESISDSAFQSSKKLEELKWLSRQYKDFLRIHNLVDQADVLRMAAASIKASRLPSNTMVLVPDGTPTTVLGERFLSALEERQHVRIAKPTRSRGAATNVAFYRAVGESNEAREILRRCIQQEIPLDQVEIVVSESQTYVPLLYDLSFRYAVEGLPVPMTFSAGLSAIHSRPGRALQGWLDWIAADYAQVMLADLISEGLFVIPGDQAPSVALISRLLRPLGIGQGSANYLPKIDEQLCAGKQSQTRASEADLCGINRRRAAYRALKKLVKELIELGESFRTGSTVKRMTTCDQFLRQHARATQEIDKAAVADMRGRIQQQSTWHQQFDLVSDGRAFLRGLAGQTRVMSSGPKPGHLHVSTLASAGASGRPNVFILGMDDHRFPGMAIQDPVLLDRECQQICDDLDTSDQQIRRKLDDATELLNTTNARVTLSWSCEDLVDHRESFPSPFLLSVLRERTDDSNADVQNLYDNAGVPVAFAPSSADKALIDSDRWLWRLSEDDIRGSDQQAMLDSFFPHLANGRTAAAALEFGPHSGHVPQAGVDLDPFGDHSPALSASALETLGRCPLAFFFRNALRLFTLEDYGSDPGQWLDARQVGLLLHDVFRRFMVELNAEGKRCDFERDHHRLAEMLATVVGQYRCDIPPPNENSFRTQYWQLIQIARIFLHDESIHCRNNQPTYFEVAFGVPAIGEGSYLDSEQPSVVLLPSGRSIRTRGQIDRVDQVDETSYTVWDYKIGSGRGYEKRNPFQQGRKLQNVLYVSMVQAALIAKLNPEASVERFGYFFPSVRAQGLRIDWTKEELVGGLELIEKLATCVRDGVFVATDNHKEDCRFCDYQAICGDVSTIAACTDRMIKSGLPVLQHFAEARHG